MHTCVHFVVLGSVIALEAVARAQAPDCTTLPSSVTLEVGGRPESAQFDASSGFWYQGNQGSQTSATDSYVTRIGRDFTIDTLYWAGGPPNPVLGNITGIRIFDGKLYGADFAFNQTLDDNGIVVIDIATGAIEPGYAIGPSSSLGGGRINDPVVDPSTNSLYVSVRHATIVNALTTVLRVDRDDHTAAGVSNVLPPGAFGPRPNGVVVYKHGLIVVNNNGDFMEMSFADGSLTKLGTSSFGALDGIERFGDALLYTKNGGAPPTATIGVLAMSDVRPGGTRNERALCILQPGEQAADIGIDREARIVAIPHLNTGKVTFVSLDDLL